MILLAIADANYKFILLDFNINDRVLDGAVLQNIHNIELSDHKALH